MKNLLEYFLRDEPAGFRWAAMPATCTDTDGSLCVVPPPHSDFICEPGTGRKKLDASILETRIGGDFIARARVRPDFSSPGNAAGILIYSDDDNWARVCFERDEQGRAAVTTVVTRDGVSDIASAPAAEDESVWLQLIRCGPLFDMQRSGDGMAFERIRRFSTAAPFMLSLGLVVLCPNAAQASHHFDFWGLMESASEMVAGMGE
jgi:regulation of enolase protein 1 (concanavalin A-like superfamily)